MVQKSAKCHLLTWPRKAPARTAPVCLCKRQFAGAPVDAGHSDGENLAPSALKTPFGGSRRAGSSIGPVSCCPLCKLLTFISRGQREPHESA